MGSWARAAVLFSFLPWPCLADPGEPTTLEEAVAAQGAQIAELAAQLAEHPEASDLWQRWILLSGQQWIMVRQLQGAPHDEEASRLHAQALYEEWIRAHPGSTEAHLALGRTLPQESRTPYYVQLAERFPAAPEVQLQAAEALHWAGDHPQADQIVERFLANHPEVPEAHGQAYNHFQRAGNALRAGQILAVWVATHPADPRALRALLTAQGYEEEGREQVAATLRQGIEVLKPSAGARGLCGSLSSHSDPTMVEVGLACYRRLLAADLPAEEEAEVFIGLTQALDHAGQTTLSAQLLEALSTEDRSRALVMIARQRAQQKRCGEAADLLDQAEALPRPPGSAFLAGIFGACGANPAVEERLVAVAARLDADQISDLLLHWWREQLLGGVEALALEHLRRHPDDAQAWSALDGTYERTGQRQRRLALLRSWIEAAGPEGVGSKTYENLAELLVAEGRLAEAISLFEDLTVAGTFGDQPYYLDKLAYLYLAAEQPDRAAEVADRIDRLNDEEGRGDLILARIAADHEDWDVAFQRYHGFLTEHPKGGDPLLEFASLAVARGQEAMLFELLEERHRKLSAEGSAPGDGEDWVAAQLEELGLLEPALAYLETASTRAPGRAELHLRIAEAAEDLGEWGRAAAAWRALLGLDPENTGHWYRLGALELRRGDPGRALEVVTEAVGSLGTRPPNLGLLLAEAHLASEDPIEAVRVLREVLADDPEYTRADELLRAAYRQLGRPEEDNTVAEEP